MPVKIEGRLDARLVEAVESSADPDRLRADLDQFMPNADVRVVTRGVETARIRRLGDRYRIEFGRDFLTRELKAPEDLLFVFLHECFHHVLGHLTGAKETRSPMRREAENIAADIQVNRAVCERFFPGGVRLLERMYDPHHPVAALLCPPEGTRRQQGRLFRQRLRQAGVNEALVRQVWRVYALGWYDATPFEALADEVERLLEVVGYRVRIVFLGDHDASERVEGLPWDREGGSGAGYDVEVVEIEVPEPVVVVRSPRVAQVVRAALDQDANNPRRMSTPTAVTSPLFGPGRLDYPFLAIGYWPTLFHGPRHDMAFEEQRARVYVDVSGSFDHHAARVFGFLVALRDEVGPTVYQFSNEVVEVSMQDIARGVKRTTGGTDFDCVVEHALRHRFRRIVVISDGIGDLDPANAEAFRASGASLYLVLSEDRLMAALGPLGDLARHVWELD